MTFDREKAQRDLNELMERDPREYSTAIGAGIVLTEHMQAALDEIARLRSDRENLAGRLNSAEAQIIQYDEYAARFRQDYEEQAKRIAELENPANVLCRLDCRLKEMSADPLLVEAGKRIADLEAELSEFHVAWAEENANGKEMKKRIAELEGAAKADERRLIAAAKKAGIEYFGCDTPDHLADRVLELQEVLVEERAKDDSKFPELCDIVHDELMCPALDGDCEHWEGCPRKDELRQKAREQLRSEGTL